MDATRKLIEKIIAMRNDARASERAWRIEPHVNASHAERWRQLKNEHNKLLLVAAELGLAVGMNLWEGE